MEIKKTTKQEKEVLMYLNRLKKANEMFLFGPIPRIQELFDTDKKEAKRLLSLWIDNFNEEGNYDEVKVKKENL